MPASTNPAEFHDMLRLAQQGFVHWPDTVLDIDRRAREGDEVWRGDPTMFLAFNYVQCKWEIVAKDEQGNEYIAASSDTPDLNLIHQLARGDWRRGKALAAELAKRNDGARQAHEDAMRDARLERIDRAAHDLRKVVGHHYGGLSRKIFSFSPEGRR